MIHWRCTTELERYICQGSHEQDTLIIVYNRLAITPLAVDLRLYELQDGTQHRDPKYLYLQSPETLKLILNIPGLNC